MSGLKYLDQIVCIYEWEINVLVDGIININIVWPMPSLLKLSTVLSKEQIEIRKSLKSHLHIFKYGA